MIYDKISNMKNYEGYSKIYEALSFLARLGNGELPEPGTELVKGESFCNPVEFTTKPEKECKFEAHRKYIDLHYIVEGVECIATADVKALEVVSPFDETKDAGFYEGKEDGRYYLRSGDFMVCYPSDAHKVGMMEQAPGAVKKVVVKIMV